MNPFDRPANPFDRPALPREEREPDTDQLAPAPEAVSGRHEDVVTRVRELLGKYPTLGSRQLFDLATRMHPDLEETGFRSFHARYVLPLKREQARAEGRLPKPRAAKTGAQQPRRRRTSQAPQPVSESAPLLDATQLRARIREVLLRLARQVAIAESRADLVDALARVEELVEEVLQAVQHPEGGPAQTVLE